MKPRVRNLLVACFLALLCAGMLARYLHRVPRRHYCDFRVYHHTAQVFLAGNDIYAQDSVNITPFKYSPFFAFLTGPLGVIPIKPAAAIFFVVNFLATIVFFRWGSRLSASGAVPFPQAFFIYFLSAVAVSRFVVQVWDSGQVPVIMCALAAVSLYLFSRGRDIPAAALLAASIMFKYLPAIIIPYLIVKRKFKAAVLVCLFTAAWLLLPAVYAGIARNNQYLLSWLPSIIRTSLDPLSYYDFKNQSLLALVLRLVHDTPYGVNFISLPFRQALMIAYGACACLYALVLVPGRNRDRRMDYALLFAFFPLFNPNGWMINFAALAVPYIFILNYLREVNYRDRFVLALTVASFLFTSLMNEQLAGNAMENWASTLSFVTVGCLLLTAGLVKIKFSPVTAEAAPHK